ncbi:MAG: hypothetical protein IKV96_05090 [Firmicutes bacterium]|nr:hypothetical protein [Bacillota bacterium]
MKYYSQNQISITANHAPSIYLNSSIGEISTLRNIIENTKLRNFFILPDGAADSRNPHAAATNTTETVHWIK